MIESERTKLHINILHRYRGVSQAYFPIARVSDKIKEFGIAKKGEGDKDIQLRIKESINNYITINITLDYDTKK